VRDEELQQRAAKRRATGDELVEQTTERVDITAVIYRAGGKDLLWCHVWRRAEQLRTWTEPNVWALGQFGDAEIKNLGLLSTRLSRIADQEDILRCDIAVDDARVVSSREG